MQNISVDLRIAQAARVGITFLGESLDQSIATASRGQAQPATNLTARAPTPAPHRSHRAKAKPAAKAVAEVLAPLAAEGTGGGAPTAPVPVSTIAEAPARTKTKTKPLTKAQKKANTRKARTLAAKAAAVGTQGGTPATMAAGG